jgi:uncharacterized oxidoreductase
VGSPSGSPTPAAPSSPGAATPSPKTASTPSASTSPTRDSILRARDEVLRAHPDLDVVITMSGVLVTEDLRDPVHAAAAGGRH